MFTTLINIREAPWEIAQEPRWYTFIPSPILLHLFLENGWKVVKIELVPSEDQLGFIYLVTLESDSCQQYKQLVLPRTILIEKILEQHGMTVVQDDDVLSTRGLQPTI
jgi:hypothetical protein